MSYIEVIPEAKKKRGRKSVESLVEAILQEIPTSNVINVLQLSESVNCSWRTAEKWLSLIWRIQRGPKIFALKQEGGKRLVWQKERGSLPDKPVS